MVGHGGSSAGSYLADPTSPIPSHCASIVMTSTVRVNTVLYAGWGADISAKECVLGGLLCSSEHTFFFLFILAGSLVLIVKNLSFISNAYLEILKWKSAQLDLIVHSSEYIAVTHTLCLVSKENSLEKKGTKLCAWMYKNTDLHISFRCSNLLLYCVSVVFLPCTINYWSNPNQQWHCYNSCISSK